MRTAIFNSLTSYAGLGLKQRDKFYARRSEYLVVEIAERTGICCEIKAQLVGTKCLRLAVIFAVHFIFSVFAVTEQRMPHVGKLRAQLMGAAGNQIALDQR